MTGTVPAVVDVSGGNLVLVVVVALIALGALAMAAMFRAEVMSAAEGTDNMKSIAQAVQEGANAYLTRQFRTLAIFAGIAFFALLALPADDAVVRIFRSVAFLGGAGFSAAVGYFGMSLAVQANLRVAAAAQTQGRDPAMHIGFRTGATVGMLTVGLGLLGASVVVLCFQDDAPEVLEGFGFGAALLAMFMRVGGGIFTKAADVGADLVGKVENNIPEDDPRNAATIADNVGDNVGDCAGMAADLFESYAVTLVAALILGSQAFGDKGLVFPLLIPAIGALTAVAGIYLCQPRAGENGLTTINRAFYISAGIGAVASVLLAFVYLPGDFSELSGLEGGSPLDAAFGFDPASGSPAVIAALAVLIGIVLAAAILALTGYFTGTEFRPVKDVGRTSLTGAATVILSGLSVGFESAVYTTLVIGAAVFGAFLLGAGSLSIALFAVALAGCGLLTTVGVIVAMDTFGPVSDNAQGIAEMSGDVSDEGAQILTELDAVGNTTKAVTKGYAIGSAGLAALVLFAAYTTDLREFFPSLTVNFSLENPYVIVGLLLGALLPYLFGAMGMTAVGRAAGDVVKDVRDQFAGDPGIMAGTSKPNYARTVDLVTKAAIKEMIIPSLLPVLAPIVVYFVISAVAGQENGFAALGALLLGVIVGGLFVALSMTSGGGAWDNAKKYIEDGNHGGKGSEAHKAAVTGDTVGDPYKDTAGPAVNPMIKITNIVALLLLAALAGHAM